MDHAADLPRILLVGKPNSGKSLLFNRLTGLRQKVANFPGVTVEVKSGTVDGQTIVDLPGLYSLNAVSIDEKVAVEQFRAAVDSGKCSVVMCMLDGTRLERSLVLGLEVRDVAQAAKLPLLFAMNMADELRAAKQVIDVAGLSQALKAPVVPISARTREGLEDLKKQVRALSRVSAPTLDQDRANTLLAWQSFDGQTIDYPQQARDLAKKFAPAVGPLLKRQTTIDGFALHPAFGVIAFLVTMAVLFQSVFTWAEPMMDAVEGALGYIGDQGAALMPTPLLADLFKDGILGGMAAVVVFVPQIFLLTLLIGLLEDSGYLARAAMICHRPLSMIGLSGKSFVPMLTGHACAIPAIMAARTIESPRARWLTWLTIPLMSCSARLPVYGLLIAALIPDTQFLGGVFGLKGLTLLSLYLFGIAGGLLTAAIINRFASRKTHQAIPLVLELPPYRAPSLKPLLYRSMTASFAFIRRAGWTIFLVSLVVWILGYFPDGPGHLETSYLSSVGRSVAPIFDPIALDWKFAVAVITSFLAREVFVGTLGVLMGIEGADENVGGLAEAIQQQGMSLASGLALLAFFAIALQCVSTVAVLQKETGSKTTPWVMAGVYSLAAYVVAVIVYWLTNMFTTG